MIREKERRTENLTFSNLFFLLIGRWRKFQKKRADEQERKQMEMRPLTSSSFSNGRGMSNNNNGVDSDDDDDEEIVV